MKTLLILIISAASACAADPYEILIRLNPDGSIRGAHQQLIESGQPLPPTPIGVEQLPATLDPALARIDATIAEIDALQAKAAELDAAKAAQAKAEQERDDVRSLAMQVIPAAKSAVETLRTLLGGDPDPAVAAELDKLSSVITTASTPAAERKRLELERQKAALEKQISELIGE